MKPLNLWLFLSVTLFLGERCEQCSFIQHAHLRKDDTHHAPRSVTELH